MSTTSVNKAAMTAGTATRSVSSTLRSSVFYPKKTSFPTEGEGREKPWKSQQKKNYMVGKSIRTKLPGVEVYDRELEFACRASPRVTLRLERVVGTDKVRITDSRYMHDLSKKMEIEERKNWRKRVIDRQNQEKIRYRNLVIDGVLEPGPDMMYLTNHPIYRVNRMMNRISKFDYKMDGLQNPNRIHAHEPFDEIERTGKLFGWHPDHYLHSKNRPATVSHTGSSIKDYDMTAKSAMDEYGDEDEEKAIRSDESEAFAKVSDDDVLFIEGRRSHDTEALTKVIRQQSLTQARRYLGLDGDQLERDFGQKKAKVIEELYSESKDKHEEMFSYADALRRLYKLENIASDEFCSKTLRKLFI